MQRKVYEEFLLKKERKTVILIRKKDNSYGMGQFLWERRTILQERMAILMKKEEQLVLEVGDRWIQEELLPGDCVWRRQCFSMEQKALLMWAVECELIDGWLHWMGACIMRGQGRLLGKGIPSWVACVLAFLHFAFAENSSWQHIALCWFHCFILHFLVVCYFLFVLMLSCVGLDCTSIFSFHHISCFFNIDSCS